MAEQIPQSPSSVTILRANLRERRKQQRLSFRNESSDAYRVGVVSIQDIVSKLDSITQKDVTGMAARIKRRKGATEEDLTRLSHAFLLDTENIVIFTKITGALNVIVKELTGNDSTRQVLACECLCNISLGNDVVCEKLVSAAASYLILYLQSSHKSLAITSAWTLSNILISDRTQLIDTLLSQGLIPKLAELLKMKISNDELITESLKCLYIVLKKHEQCLRPEDKAVFSKMFPDLVRIDTKYSFEVTYHALYACDYKLSHEDTIKILEKCVEFLCFFADWPMASPEGKFVVSVVIRMTANLVALRQDIAFFKINGELSLRNKTIGTIIGELLKVDPVFRNELMWLAGNILKVNSTCRDDILCVF